jgi:ATP-dependent helicase HrpA
MPVEVNVDLSQALTRDQRRLRSLLSAVRAKPGDAALRASFDAAFAASSAARARRAASVPATVVDPSLPIAAHSDRIVELLTRHQVLVIAGETGSGKTTQLPKLCLAAGRGVSGLIGCTQPRRIAARAVSRRVASELGVEMGGLVGFQVRFTDQVTEHSLIKFMTDGILLAEIRSDPWLSRYDTIILDEAHERSLNIDFLLGYLKQLLPRRRDLKLIVTSATIDTARFAQFFDAAPVLEVEGRGYPVSLRYRPLIAPEEEGEPPSMLQAVVAACEEISAEDPRGDVLIFLPGERQIRDVHKALEARKYRATEVLPLYARLSARDQDRVFNPGVGRRIVLATNVAETSLTVPRIRYVVDPGLARVKRYSPRSKLDRLHIEPISQASAEQRKGRCGRVSAGVCYRLYDEAEFLARPAFTDPEIRRASLAGVILRMLDLRLGRVEDFPFLEPPDSRAVTDGWQQLVELGAVPAVDAGRSTARPGEAERTDRQRKSRRGRGERSDAGQSLTAIGRQMARLPVDPKLARMLIAAAGSGCLSEVLAIAAFLAIQDPRERPADARQAADTAHGEFADGKSEFSGIVRLWDAYRLAHEELTQSKLRDWCAKRFLSFLRLREWRELHRQLLLNCREQHWALNDAPADYGRVHRALIAGLPGQVGHRTDKQVYEGPRGRKYQLFPGSPLARKPPPWVLSAAVLDTERVWGLINAAIEPDWIIDAVPHLLARKHYDPRWSRAQGRVLGSEQISLFGLVLAPKRPVHYGGLYPDVARDIFVRDGLVAADIDCRSGFLERNLKTLEKAREEEAKLRRAGLVADEDWQARWYLDRLPADINSASALDKWFRGLDAAQRKALEWSLADLLPGEGGDNERFPKFLAVGRARLALHYQFEPGGDADGVTLDLPLHLLAALDPARLQWLVPGLLEDKATALIRGLPKALRRNVVPAPDFARAFAEAFPQATADSLVGELARFLAKLTGAEIAATDFDERSVEAHLRMNLRLLDEDGRVLAISRDLDALRGRYGAQAERAFAQRAGRELAGQRMERFPDPPIPDSIPGDAGMTAYPALVDEGDAVRLDVFAEPRRARIEHPRGVARLLRLALTDPVRRACKQLPISAKTGLLYASIEHAERLREDLVEASLLSCLERVEPAGIRELSAFEAARDTIARGLFAEAMNRLTLAEAILTETAALRPELEAPLMGWARANLDDLLAQLAALIHPGFLRETPPSALAQYPRYLKAMRLRAERAKRDPTRDQARMLELMPFVDALEAARADGRIELPEWQSLRWDVEELRVSLFAQELGTARPVSVKRLARQLNALQRH